MAVCRVSCGLCCVGVGVVESDLALALFLQRSGCVEFRSVLYKTELRGCVRA